MNKTILPNTVADGAPTDGLCTRLALVIDEVGVLAVMVAIIFSFERELVGNFRSLWAICNGTDLYDRSCSFIGTVNNSQINIDWAKVCPVDHTRWIDLHLAAPH